MSIREKFGGLFRRKESLPSEEYIEIDLKKDLGKRAKIIVRPYVMREYEDVDKILEGLREGFSIALIDIKYMKGKDVIELKRAIAKLKKTSDALGGDIAGFGENLLIITPSFVKIYRGEKISAPEKVERID